MEQYLELIQRYQFIIVMIIITLVVMVAVPIYQKKKLKQTESTEVKGNLRYIGMLSMMSVCLIAIIGKSDLGAIWILMILGFFCMNLDISFKNQSTELADLKREIAELKNNITNNNK